MRIGFICLVVFFGLVCLGSSVEWEDLTVVPGGVWGEPQRYGYDIYYRTGNDLASCSAQGSFLGYEDIDGFHLKQQGFTTPVDPTQPTYVVSSYDNNVWFLSYYGEILNDAALESAVRIPLVDWADTECSGGVLVEDVSDFYLGFMVTGSFTSDGLDRFGWCHVSMDENMRMSLLDFGIGFDGEPVVVGIGPIPEPSTGMLLLVGLAFAGLSRRMRSRM